MPFEVVIDGLLHCNRWSFTLQSTVHYKAIDRPLHCFRGSKTALFEIPLLIINKLRKCKICANFRPKLNLLENIAL